MKSIFNVFTGILFVAAAICFSSCQNFLNGELLKKELEKAIQHEQAPYCKVQISANIAEISTMTPAPNVTYDDKYKQGDYIDLNFEPNPNYAFLYWDAKPENCVEFEDISELKTRAKIKTDKNVIIIPTCVPRPSPTFQPNITDGVVPKNSSIIITFGPDPLAVPEKELDKISINIGETNVKEYYEKPKYANATHTQILIQAKKDHIMEFLTGEKTVTVTVPKEFYVHNGNNVDITMAGDVSSDFKINYKTEESVSIYLDNNDEFGKFDRGNILFEKFLNTEQISTYTMKPNSVFLGWDFSIYGREEEEDDDTLSIIDTEDTYIKIVKYKDPDGNEKELLELIETNISESAILENKNMVKLHFRVLDGCSEEIVIKPRVYKNPAVESYTPNKFRSGVPFDTPVTIKFNTKINHDCFSLGPDGSIKIKNKNDLSIDYSKYYEIEANEIYEESIYKTQLFLLPDVSMKELFKGKEDETFEILIRLNPDKIIAVDKDEKETTHIIEKGCDVEYTINSSSEYGKPQLLSVNIYKTKNPDGSYSDPVTDKDFSEWEEEDFYSNHARKFYIVAEGYDTESGLESVIYKEKLDKTAFNTNSNLSENSGTLGIYSQFKATNAIFENQYIVSRFETEFEFNKAYPDGLMKYEFSLVDRVGNLSPVNQTKTFYIIKDSGVAGDNIHDSDYLLSSPRKSVNGIDTVKFYFDDNVLQDKFFSKGMTEYSESYSDKLTVKKVEWGYTINCEKGVLTPKLETYTKEYNRFDDEQNDVIVDSYDCTGDFYTIERDETRETYLRFTVEDGVGNIYSKMVAIPEKAIYIGERDLYSGGKESLFKAYNTECPIEYSAAYINYYTSDIAKDKLLGGTASRFDTREDCHLEDGVTYISAGSNKRFEAFINEYDFNGWKICGTYSQVYDKEEATYSLTDDDMPSDLKLTSSIIPVQLNSGYTEFKVSYPEDFNKNENYLYLTAIRKEGHSRYTYTESDYVKIVSGIDFYVCPAVMSPDRQFKYGDEITLSTKEDTTPPNLEFIGDSSGTHEHYQRNAGYIRVEVPKDNSDYTDENGNFVTGMKANSKGIVTLDYWVIANESIDSGFKERTEADIISYPKHSISYDSKNAPEYLRLSLDGVPENSYSVYIKLEDKYGNYKFKSIYALNVLREDKPTFEYKKVKPALRSWNIGLYESWHTGLDEEKKPCSQDPHPEWWENKVPDGEKWWTSGCNLLSEEEMMNCSNYDEMYALQYAKEYDLVSEYAKEFYTYGEEQEAFVLNTGTTFGGNLVIDIFDSDNQKWNEESPIQQMSECREMVFYKDSFTTSDPFSEYDCNNINLQFFHKNGSNWDYYDWTFDLFSYSDRFVRFSSYDTSSTSGYLKDYTKQLYVYPDYYLGNMICENAALQPVINGIQVFADAPVLVHTYYCTSDLGDEPDMWLNHGLEIGVVQKNGNFTYSKKYFDEIPSGKYYVTIAHFADGTTVMTDTSQKK